MKIITRIPRSLVATALLSAMVIAPVAVLAHDNLDSNGVRTAGAELSIQINNNGVVHVGGAKVTSVSSSTIIAATSFGSTTVSWTLNTNGTTKFVDKGGRNASLGAVAAGDVVSFNGPLVSGASTLTVNATLVKDWTKNFQILQKHTFEGTLLSAIGTTSLPTSFTLQIGGTNYTVNVGATVPILGKNWGSSSLASFQTGDKVRVYGSVQAASLTTIDAVVVRNASR